MRSLDSPDPAELTPTGKVILGMIAFGRSTATTSSTWSTRSTRYFWAASYGQIYPELKRLEEQGLMRGRSEPSGGRRADRLRAHRGRRGRCATGSRPT